MSRAAVLAAVAMGAAVLLGRPAPPRVPRRAAAGRRTAALCTLGVVTLAVLLVTTGAQRAAAAAIVLAASGGLAGLWRRRRRHRRAEAASVRVLETCELLAAELAAGRPPVAALERAAAEWPPLAPVAEAFSLGSDVPEAFRSLSRLDGARDLRLLGAAWQVAHRTGHGLAAAVTTVAVDLRATQVTRRVVESELASARATARLVAALPLPSLVLGGGAGGDPWGFLLGSPAGLGCLALGLALAVAGLWWIEAIAQSVRGARW